MSGPAPAAPARPGTAVFDALPGLEVSVGEMRRTLEHLWDGEGGAQGAPSEFRASQLNLILHFGLPTAPEEAVAQFDLALQFAQSHPCRVIALVPLADTAPEAPMRAKLYSQCFVGSAGRDMNCTEALLLAYPQETRGFVADQVSTFLDPDLPVYYWAHHFSTCRKIADYGPILHAAKRFVFDSALVPAEALTFPWPKPETVRDLAAARLLHIRQLLGQHLAGIEPARLAEGLDRVVARGTPGLCQEARALGAWARDALVRCGAAPDLGGTGEPLPAADNGLLELEFHYHNGRYFRWRADFGIAAAGFDADFGRGRELHCAPVKLATPVIALGEALLF